LLGGPSVEKVVFWDSKLYFSKKKKNLVLRCRDQRFDGVVDKRFGTIHF
jgi:hypothetical protein